MTDTSTLSPLEIGRLALPFPVVLAPMAGYTDAAFRTISRRYHCGLAFTEVVNARGLIHGSTASLHLLEIGEGERPVAAHIYGCEPHIMAEAAVMIERLQKFDIIDINAGCPIRRIVSKGCGAALMRSPDLVKDIVHGVSEAVSLPVTLKTRIGLSEDQRTITEIARAAEEGGAAAITVHARLASNKHAGPADWDALARVKEQSTIPVIGNGGIECAGDVFRMVEQTGVDGVMIGRAAVGNPWIFEEIHALASARPYEAHKIEEHRRVILEHLQMLERLNTKHPKYRKKSRPPPEYGAARHFRAHLVKYLSGFPGWREIRRGLDALHTPEDIVAAVDQVLGRRSHNHRHSR